MEHKDEEACDHVSHLDDNEMNGCANAVVSGAQLMVRMAGGTPADWAAVLAIAALAARKSLTTLPRLSRESEEHVDATVARVEFVIESKLGEQPTNATGSTEKN